jgi:hypothetical protein
MDFELQLVSCFFKMDHKTEHQWFMPVTLATEKVEVERIMVQSQCWVKSSQDPISTNNWAQRYMPTIPVTQKAEVSPGKKFTPKKGTTSVIPALVGGIKIG